VCCRQIEYLYREAPIGLERDLAGRLHLGGATRMGAAAGGFHVCLCMFAMRTAMFLVARHFAIAAGMGALLVFDFSHCLTLL
jgi:hypothetical protein